MSHASAVPVFHVVHREGSRLVLRRDAHASAELIVIAGFGGTMLPERITRPQFRAAGESWRLSCAEGDFEFRARAVERIDVRPDFYAPIHARFMLSAADRVAVRLLLWLLRFPGGARLLRRWQLSR